MRWTERYGHGVSPAIAYDFLENLAKVIKDNQFGEYIYDVFIQKTSGNSFKELFKSVPTKNLSTFGSSLKGLQIEELAKYLQNLKAEILDDVFRTLKAGILGKLLAKLSCTTLPKLIIFHDFRQGLQKVICNRQGNTVRSSEAIVAFFGPLHGNTSTGQTSLQDSSG